MSNNTNINRINLSTGKGHTVSSNSLPTRKASDLVAYDVIIDPEGNTATVTRIRRIDHQRGRLETDLGVAVVDLNQVFPLVVSGQ